MRSYALLFLSFVLVACGGSSAQQNKPDDPPTEPTAEASAEAPAEQAPAEAEPASDEAASGEEDTASAAAPASNPDEWEFEMVGSADDSKILGVIGQKKPDVYECYKAELENSPGLTGKVLTRITLSASGDVAAAMVKESTLNNKNVEQCLTKAIRGWKFPPAEGGLVVVTYPFTFPP